MPTVVDLPLVPATPTPKPALLNNWARSLARVFDTCSAQPAATLAEGSHTWKVRAVDAAGNAGTYSAQRGFSYWLCHARTDVPAPERLLRSVQSEAAENDLRALRIRRITVRILRVGCPIGFQVCAVGLDRSDPGPAEIVPVIELYRFLNREIDSIVHRPDD